MSFKETYVAIYAKWTRKVSKKHYIYKRKWIRFTILQIIKKPLVKHCFEATGKVDKIPYTTCRLRRLLEQFLQNRPKIIKKTITFSLKIDSVSCISETSKPISQTVFWSIQKSWWKYLIKPVDPWWFRAQNAKWPPECSKSIRFSL